MKRLTVVLLMVVLCQVGMADEPFRKHRFDSFRRLQTDSNAILFVGNSITDMFPWAEAFGPLPAGEYVCNRGVSGATSDEVLEALPNMLAGHPKKMFLMIGTNDLGLGKTPQHVARNVAEMIQYVKGYSPETEVFIQSILPSEVGGRTLEDEMAANVLLRQVADSLGGIFIDLWEPLMPILTDKGYSFDGLHLTAQAYQVWCSIVAPYIGKECAPRLTIGSNPTYAAGLWWSHGMRATYFNSLPFSEEDILFFGDEMVKGGEWNELLADRHILNRGSHWGYDGVCNSLAITKAMMEATRNGATAKPKAVWVYTATGEVNRGVDLDSLLVEYQTLADYFEDVPLYVIGLMPSTAPNEDIVRFNAMLRNWAAKEVQVRYVDIYSVLAKEGVADSEFFIGNYLNSRGYNRVANILSGVMEEPRNFDYRMLKVLEDSRTPEWTRHWLWVSNSLALSPVLSGGATLAGNYEVGVSWTVNALATMAIKYIVNRPRPWVRYEGLLHCEQTVPDPSFPSGHTSFCFNTATSLALAYPKWYVTVPAFLWAGSVGFSRLYLGAHFPTDVLAGALLGASTAWLTHYVYQRCMADTEAPLPKDAVLLPPVAVRF